MLLGHGATDGLGSTLDPSGGERKPGAESKPCGQTLTDALGTISASSAARLTTGVSPVCLTHTHSKLLFLYIDFRMSVSSYL